MRWLKKLYKDAKDAELEQQEIEPPDTSYPNPFDEQRFEKYEEEDFDNEVNNLIEWIEDLDYDKYVSNW